MAVFSQLFHGDMLTSPLLVKLHQVLDAGATCNKDTCKLFLNVFFSKKQEFNKLLCFNQFISSKVTQCGFKQITNTKLLQKQG